MLLYAHYLWGIHSAIDGNTVGTLLRRNIGWCWTLALGFLVRVQPIVKAKEQSDSGLRTMAIFGAVVIVLDWLILPLKPVHGSVSRKLKQIDYIGIFLSAALTVFLLVPISGGGSTFSWDGATVIAMLVVGGICALAFIWWEWKVAKLPILPSEPSVRS